MPWWAQRSASQVPGKQTRDGHGEPLAVRGDGLEKGFRSGLHVAVPQDCSRLRHDADVQAPSVESHSTAKRVWLGVETPEVSSSAVSGVAPCQLTSVVG
jgi:hypothetical protein